MKTAVVTSRWISFLENKRLGWVIFYIGLVVLIVLVVGLFVFMLVQDLAASGTLPEGTTVAGVSVGSLSKEDAVRKCERELAYVEERPVSVIIDDERYNITPQELGLKLDYAGMVDDAYAEAWDVNIFQRMIRRFLDRPRPIDVPLKVTYDEKVVENFVASALGSVNREPEDATIDVTSGQVVIVPAKDGRMADQNQLLAATKEALEGKNRTVVAQVQRTPAAFTADNIGKVIIINTGSHTLSLYEKDQLVKQYPIACGQPAWPTPTGGWRIRDKRKNPVWTNPGTPWAASMPPYIPPGPSNPLGTRALALNAPGVLVHGTRSTGSIGRSASHGCIRMYMSDVEELFELVEVGTPVFIIRGPGDETWKNKPYWRDFSS